MTAPKALTPDQLYKACDLGQFGFNTTEDLKQLETILGQQRAVDALQFGVGIKQEGFNLFVLGPPGVGKHTLIRQYLEQQSKQATTPSDWVYVANFNDTQKPRAIDLPPGRGTKLKQDMQRLIDDLRSAIPSAFDTEQYQHRHQQLQDALQEKTSQAFENLTEEALKNNVFVLRGEEQITFVPARDGKPMTQDEYDALESKERKRLDEVIKELEEKLRQFFKQRQQWQAELRERLRNLNREVGMFAAGHLIEELRNKYTEVEEVAEYLGEVQEDVIENLHMFFPERPGSIFERTREEPYFRNYQVNVLVANAPDSGAPVVFEDAPRYQNLVGRIEHISQMGTLITDYMLIKPGALHKANGGYLILDALKLLQQPYAWEGLKRALSAKSIKIQSLGEIYSLISTVSLEPELIPLDLKVVLVGERILYYLLTEYDPEFAELFKVAADFEDTIERNTEHYELYAQLIATLVQRDKLLPFERAAVERVIEHSSRMAEDVEKLSMHILNVADLLREADYWARQEGAKLVSRQAVQTAIDKQIYRSDRIRQRYLEEFRRGTLLLDTTGETIGQVNGLVVIQLNNIAFGHPSRITATARLGEGEVVDIEREVELGGAIHSKGVFIISAFLAARYAHNKPLSLAASLVFEQSYSAVEGDSASVGELCALLSALAQAPIRQNLAITGSVNQHGQVQPIGGVNEKIEGFFDVCREKGFSKDQGVIIPQSNVSHLMLRQDVVDAVQAGQFQIYPVTTVDDAISLLTGLEAGEADDKGEFPIDTLNGRVDARLRYFAELRHEFAKGGEEHHDSDEDKENDDAKEQK
jgi:lon-related putative ATP-dependent protease